MPILEFSITAIKQECVVCGSVHTIPLKQGVSKSKKEPYALLDGDTLEIKVDGAATPQVITFAADDFVTITAATAAEVVAKINASLTGAAADADNGAVRIVSASSARGTSSVEVSGGTARDKLGFDGRPCGARVLGVTIGTGASKHTAPDTIDLPHCPDCGSKECLVRTWDTVPPEHAASIHGRHRKVVNALAEHLKGHGFSDPDAKVIHDAETASPPDILDTPSLTGPSRTLPSVRAAARARRGET
jgi:hypothetical protein